MRLAISVLAVLAFVAIVVNERFGRGASDTWLSIQVATLLGGLSLVLTTQVGLGLTLLFVSDLAGSFGFLILWATGNRRFTKPIFSGIKNI